MEKFIVYMSNIDFVEAKHSPRGSRDLRFEPSFIVRGLSELHLELTPAKS